jgi:hypothetical protein
VVGLVRHPTDYIDLYAMAALSRRAKPRSRLMERCRLAYGNPLYNNTACQHEAASVTDGLDQLRGEYLSRLAGFRRLLVERLQRRFRLTPGRRARLIH